MTDVGLGVRGGVNPLYDPSKVDSTKPKDTTGGVQNLKAPQDYKLSHRVLSGAQLMKDMGGPPSTDVKIFGHTVKTNSVAYKSALDHLQTYQQQVDSLKDQRLEKVPKGVIDSMKQQLQDVVNAAGAYERKHGNSASKGARTGVMAELKAIAQEEMGRLDELSQGKMTGLKGKDVNIGEGLALLRGGITDASAFNRDLNDSIVDEKKSKTLGSGKLNTVEQVCYGGEMRAVKPLNKGGGTLDETTGKMLLAKGEEASGFDKGNMLIAARNLATARVANLLGLANSVPMPDIVIRNGQACLAMKPAPGERLINKGDVELTNPKEIANCENANAETLKNWNAYQKDGKWYQPGVQFKDIPYTSTTNPKLAASVQLGLLDLQALHCLLGQIDGTQENIFIQVKGDNTALVTGIDQDMCLGRDFNTLEIPNKWDKALELKGTYAGPPPLMSRDFYDALMSLTEDQLKYALGPEMPAEEKANAVTRLRLLKAHAATLNPDRVIDNDKFDSWTHATTGEDVGTFCKNSGLRSYIQRDSATLEKVTKKVALDMTKHV